MGPPGLLTKLQQAQFGSLETALETEALETGQTPVMCFGSGHQMATCQVFFRGGKGWTHKTITRLEVSGSHDWATAIPPEKKAVDIFHIAKIMDL